jgi:hypothetical protein
VVELRAVTVRKTHRQDQAANLVIFNPAADLFVLWRSNRRVLARDPWHDELRDAISRREGSEPYLDPCGVLPAQLCGSARVTCTCQAFSSIVSRRGCHTGRARGEEGGSERVQKATVDHASLSSRMFSKLLAMGLRANVRMAENRVNEARSYTGLLGQSS